MTLCVVYALGARQYVYIGTQSFVKTLIFVPNAHQLYKALDLHRFLELECCIVKIKLQCNISDLEHNIVNADGLNLQKS